MNEPYIREEEVTKEVHEMLVRKAHLIFLCLDIIPNPISQISLVGKLKEFINFDEEYMTSNGVLKHIKNLEDSESISLGDMSLYGVTSHLVAVINHKTKKYDIFHKNRLI